jgi:hypothetical protein
MALVVAQVEPRNIPVNLAQQPSKHRSLPLARRAPVCVPFSLSRSRRQPVTNARSCRPAAPSLPSARPPRRRPHSGLRCCLHGPAGRRRRPALLRDLRSTVASRQPDAAPALLRPAQHHSGAAKLASRRAACSSAGVQVRHWLNDENCLPMPDRLFSLRMM